MKSSAFKKIVGIAVAGALAVSMLGIVACSSPAPSDQSPTPASTDTSLQKAATPTGKHHATIKIEGYDELIELELDGDSAPVTVQNFIELANLGFYDGLTFHRIINGFMMQGGDPEGNGTGGSGQNIIGEFSSNGYDNELQNIRGAIAMARSSDPDSASSQFFIVQEDSPHLDGEYAVFGHVTSGMDIVDEICAAANPTDNKGTIAAKDQPVIEDITIID